MDETRRSLLKGAAYLSAFGLPPLLADTSNATQVTPFPLEAVRLRPSPYLTAVQSNGVYLLRLEVERTYALRADARQKEFVVIRFEPEVNGGAGPVFGCRILQA